VLSCPKYQFLKNSTEPNSSKDTCLLAAVNKKVSENNIKISPKNNNILMVMVFLK
jgi:hypothetical protein